VENCPIRPGETWRLTVFGRPVQQGDLSAIPHKRGGRWVKKADGSPLITTIHGNEKALKPWRQEIAGAAIDAGWPGLGIGALDESLFVSMTFYFARPQNQLGTGRNAGVVKDSSPLWPEATGPDVDKLARAVLDALTGLVWKDDKRIVSVRARRRFGVPERLELAVRRPHARTVGDLRLLRDRNPELAAGIEAMQLDLFEAVAAATAA
jgi:Holliday junction resolvase RusA-like endonuclease